MPQTAFVAVQHEQLIHHKINTFSCKLFINEFIFKIKIQVNIMDIDIIFIFDILTLIIIMFQ